MDLNGKCVLLGVSGGIAAYKMANVASALRKLGADFPFIQNYKRVTFFYGLVFVIFNLFDISRHPCVHRIDEFFYLRRVREIIFVQVEIIRNQPIKSAYCNGEHEEIDDRGFHPVGFFLCFF